MKDIQPHQERVINECSDLTENLDKLQDFIESGKAEKIVDKSELQRLNRQLLLMSLYQQVLVERIEAF